MSAGIISACLPTLGPVMAFCAGKLGIKRTLLSSRNGGTTHASSSKNFAHSATASLSDRTEVELQKSSTSRKDGAGAFYRLPDGQMSGETAGAVDSDLRPKHGYKYTVTSQPGKGDGASLSGDEVPLHGIRVHTDFKQSES